MPYQRKYDFQPGTKISSSQVDEEFNNLINAANTLESGVNDRYTKSEVDNKFAVRDQENWLSPTLLNGWVAAYNGESTPAYKKSSTGWVHLKGTVRSGGIGEGLPVFYLPVGYRPLEKIKVSSTSHDGNSYIAGRIGINPDGRVYLDAGGSGSAYFDSISFFAEQ